MSSLAVKWWRLRLLWVQQQLFDEKSEIIFQSAKKLCENINLDYLNDEGKIHFHLEVATFNLSYFDINLIQTEVGKAAKFAGISVQVLKLIFMDLKIYGSLIHKNLIFYVLKT